MNDKYDDAGILIRPIVKLESEMDIEQKIDAIRTGSMHVIAQLTIGEQMDMCKRIRSLEVENARLQSEIDAANAQPAIGEWHCSKNNRGDNWVKFVDGFEPVRGMKLYARPIPAQQSPASDSEALPFVPWSKEKDFFDSMQQSPSVAVPEWVLSAVKRNLCPADSCDFHGNQDPYLSGGCCKPELQKAISYLESLPSPRITEQDLREIFIQLGFPEMMFGDWMKNRGGRALLAKLNNPDSVGG